MQRWRQSDRLMLAICLAVLPCCAASAADVPASPGDPYAPAGGYANQGSRVAQPRVAAPAAPPLVGPPPAVATGNQLNWAGQSQASAIPPTYNQPPGAVRPAAHAEAIIGDDGPGSSGPIPGLPIGLPAQPADPAPASDSPAPPSAVPAARRGTPIPLAPPSRDKGSHETPARTSSPTGSIITVGTSLAIVLGLFLVAVWFLRRGLPGGPPQLPSDALSVLGQLPLTGRQSLHLVRLGGKLILVCTNGEETNTLTEITELAEVERIAATCALAQPTSQTATFRDLLTQMSAEPAAAGFLGDSGRPARDLAAAYGGGQDDE